MVRLNWTPRSLNDLDSIAEFISEDSVKYAKIQVKRIRNKARIIKDHIYIGRLVPEYNDPSIRELIMGNYRIIYKIFSTIEIDILTIHHSARMLKL
ncbi:MAG: type II toxin-antitoxin system RelE/ParE family toxin [Saprospiraceae bacterium]|nr:type II toxin-antitoxin system RelE/ParE family toxin [Saprospiraceae bacterium]MBK7737240.1 type II toxin-antitoxin system RelE/ParE family toxin [Saprospiraceae bacterium]MBK7914166.1 type II toxin-antitoxin system RelE/ParE family toxin [Saprospiraceae bacterium]